MCFTPLYALVFAHMLADYVFQTEKVALGKGYNIMLLLIHGLIVLALSAVAVCPFFSDKYAYGLIALFIVHMVNDLVKARLSNQYHQLGFQLYLLDQFLHFLYLYLIWVIAYPPSIAPSWAHLTHYLHRSAYLRGLQISPAAINQFLLCLSAYIFIIRGGSHIVQYILSYLGAPDREPNSQPSQNQRFISDQLIGHLERVIMLTLFLLNQYLALVLLLAAKTIARIKNLEDRRPADYYLVGTFASTIVALGIDILIKNLPK